MKRNIGKKIITAALVLLLGTATACTPPAPTPTPTPAPEPVGGATVGLFTDGTLARAALNASFVDGGDWLPKIEANEDYLEQLDEDKLLYYYYRHAGVETPARLRPYMGCEGSDGDPDLGGMTLGHYLSACSMRFAATGEEKWLIHVSKVVNGLEKCQKDNGFVFAKDESVFEQLKTGPGGGVYFYFMHKTLAGLIDAYNLCGNEKALAVAEKLSDWIHAYMSPLTEAQRATVLITEYGGMNEALYNLYAITGKDRDRENAEAFNEAQYLNSWANNVDNLTMKHGNTTVPKAVGMARGYMLTGDEKLLTAAKNFFAMMVTEGKRIFATGGFSEREMIGERGKTSMMIHDCPSETCKSYNMLKLAMYLYEITGEGEYAEYAERVLFNSIMGSIDDDGCKTYYQWLGTDQRKVFHTPLTSFWCCTGTGMESFSKLGEAAWMRHGDNGLRTLFFITSSYDDGKMGVRLVNEGERNTLTVTRAFDGYLELRVPQWADGVSLTVNGEPVSDVRAEGGIVSLYKNWAVGDTIVYTTTYKLVEEPTPDDETLFALRYGPYVLAAVGERYEVTNHVSAVTGIRPGESDVDYIVATPEFDIPMRRYGAVVGELYTVYFRRDPDVASIKKSIAMRAEITTSTRLPYLIESLERFEGMYYDQRSTGKAEYLFPIHDGVVPMSSAGIMSMDKTMFRGTYTYEPFTYVAAGNSWFGYTFDQKYTITGVRLFWALKTSIHVEMPTSWHIEYFDGMNWAPVSNASRYSTADGWNEVTFDPVNTRKLRLVIDSKTPCGIYEWEVVYE